MKYETMPNLCEVSEISRDCRVSFALATGIGIKKQLELERFFGVVKLELDRRVHFPPIEDQLAVYGPEVYA
jgi:hypothetical protein